MEQAKDYFKRRVTFVTEQMEKIQAAGIRKNEIRDGNALTLKLYVLSN
jgi:prefoldin alpha subunit